MDHVQWWRILHHHHLPHTQWCCVTCAHAPLVHTYAHEHSHVLITPGSAHVCIEGYQPVPNRRRLLTVNPNSIFCWGDNSYGQAGTGSAGAAVTFANAIINPVAVPASVPGGTWKPYGCAGRTHSWCGGMPGFSDQGRACGATPANPFACSHHHQSAPLSHAAPCSSPLTCQQRWWAIWCAGELTGK